MTNLYSVIVTSFLCFILFTIFSTNQHMSQIFNLFYSDNFKEVMAGTEEEEEEESENSLEQKICNKLFELETCEKGNEGKPIENEEELTEEEIKEEAIINRYLEPVETETKPMDNIMETKQETGSSLDNSNGNSTILLNEVNSKDITNSDQLIKNESLSNQINQSSVNNPNVSNIIQNLNNFNQSQLIDLIASTISNANNIDKNKVTQSLNDFIEPTKAKGGNVMEALKQLSEVIRKDPTGNIANKIISVAETK